MDINNHIVYDDSVEPDVKWDGLNMPLSDESFDSLLLTEVLEHCSDPRNIFKEIYRVLKKGGIAFITTPFVFPLHESPYDQYRYTPYRIRELSDEAGFNVLSLSPLGGINGVLSQVLATYRNKYLRFLFLPIVYILGKIDDKPQEFKDDVIFTGLCAVIKK